MPAWTHIPAPTRLVPVLLLAVGACWSSPAPVAQPAAPPPTPAAVTATPAAPLKLPSDAPAAITAWTLRLASETPQGAMVLVVPPDPEAAAAAVSGCGAPARVDGADVWRCEGRRYLVVRHRPGEEGWTFVWGRG